MSYLEPITVKEYKRYKTLLDRLNKKADEHILSYEQFMQLIDINAWLVRYEENRYRRMR